MIDISVLVNQLIHLFLIICIGYLVYKVGIFNDAVNKHLNKLVLNVTLPLLMISSVLNMSNPPDTEILIPLFVISIGFFILMPVVAFIVVKIMLKTLRIVKSRQGVYMFMLIFSNTAFMGMPILEAACGENGSTAVFYAAVFNIFFNLGVFSYGVLIIGYGETSKATFKIKSLISPGIIGSILAIVFFLFKITLPDTLTATISSVGGLTSPIAMLLIGSSLASMKLSDVLGEWRVYVFSFLKQFILPIAFYPLFKLLISDDLLFNVIFIEFTMPIANLAFMIATEQNLDVKFVSKTIFISTAMSLITIPLVLYLCQAIY